MARVMRRIAGVHHVRDVKNLGWFFRYARKVPIERFDLWQANDGWEMFVDFDDRTTFHSPFASFSVFKDVMSRQRSLRGVEVTVHHSDGHNETIVLGRVR